MNYQLDTKLAKVVFIDPNSPHKQEIITKLANTSIITGEKWQNLSMETICPQIKQWQITSEFTAYANKQSTILKQIEHISFPFLISLNIWGNYIRSIEGLFRIRMPQLRELWIWENLIYEFGGMRKCNWPHLQILNTRDNPSLELRGITELQLLSNKFNRFNFKAIDSKFLFKLQTVSLKSIFNEMGISVHSQSLMKSRFPTKS